MSGFIDVRNLYRTLYRGEIFSRSQHTKPVKPWESVVESISAAWPTIGRLSTYELYWCQRRCWRQPHLYPSTAKV